MKKNHLYRLLSPLVISAILASCGPVSTSNSSDNDLSNFKTGGTKTVINPYTNKESVTPYVNSGDKEVFKETITEINKFPNQQRDESNKILSNKIKKVSLIFSKDRQKTSDINESNQVKLIVLIQGKNKTYHKFTTTKDSLINIHGTYAASLNTNATSKASKMIADIQCKSDSCRKALITLTIPKGTSLNSDKILDHDVVSKIAYTNTKAKIKIEARKGQEKELESSDLYKNIETINQQEEYPIDKISVVVADGISYTEVQKDEIISIQVDTTDTRKAPAKVNTSDVKIKGTEVHKSTLSGVSSEGATVLDISTTKQNSSDTKKETTINQAEVSDTVTTPVDTKTDSDHLQARITIVSQEEDLDYQEKELNKNFRLDEIKALIHSGQASWEDVGVNPKTSLFFAENGNEDQKQQALLQEADLESYREHPKVVKFIDKYQRSMCKHYIKNMAPVRKIVSQIYLQNNISPNLATNMKLESYYGTGNKKRGIGKYDVQTNYVCATAAGPHQMNKGTYESILKRKLGLVYELKQTGYDFIHHPSKKYYHGGPALADKEQCKVENPQVYVDDHRMFLETSTIIGSSFTSFIAHDRHPTDAALVYAAYNQGPWRYTKVKNPIFQSRLEEIDRFNISTFVFNDKRSSDTYIRNSIKNGVEYAFEALAIRAILSQPENYCEQHTIESIQELYNQADQQVQDPEFYNNSRILHPSGAALDSTKKVLGL